MQLEDICVNGNLTLEEGESGLRTFSDGLDVLTNEHMPDIEALAEAFAPVFNDTEVEFLEVAGLVACGDENTFKFK